MSHRREATAQSCLKQLDCENTEYGLVWKTAIGMVEGHIYLCSDDAREGK